MHWLKLAAGLLGFTLICAVGMAGITVIVTEIIARIHGTSVSSFWTAVSAGIVSVSGLLGGAFLMRR